MLTARDYQVEAVNSIFNFFATIPDVNRHPVVAMPTGTGKAFCIADFLKQAYAMYANQRVLIATHVKELIDQNYDEFMGLWPTAPAGIYSAGLGQKDLHAKITFCGIASIVKVIEQFGKIDLMLIDECHLLSQDDESMYMVVINFLKALNPNFRVIGFTATPWRAGQGRITEDGIFTDLCFDITDMRSFNRLIKEGYLIPLISKPTTTLLDVTGVHMRLGDFNKKELGIACNKDEVTWAAIQETMLHAHGRKSWLVFATSLDHCDKIRQMLEYVGVSCRVVHSKMKKTERDTNIREWKAGVFTAIINMGILTTGVNHPALDLIVMLRPTASTVLWVQALGRGTRPVFAPGFDITTLLGRLAAIAASDKHNTLVLDFAGNIKRLGPINDPVIPRKKGEKTGEVPIKECPACTMYNHLSARYCGGSPEPSAEGCGEEFIFQTKLRQTASSEQVIKIDEPPEVNAYAVDHVTYIEHHKAGKPPSIKVSYFCGLTKFTEYVHFELDGFARRKANTFWRERTQIPFPATTAEAMTIISRLAVPTHIRVWVNKAFPEVIAVTFTGSWETPIIGTEVPF